MRVNTDPEAATCPACGSRRLVVLSPAPRTPAVPKAATPISPPARRTPPTAEARAKARQVLAARPKIRKARRLPATPRWLDHRTGGRGAARPGGSRVTGGEFFVVASAGDYGSRLCVCGHPFSDHDGHGEECAECEVLLLHDQVPCPAPSIGSQTCRQFRDRRSTP
jgi:hypothetical protein